MWIQIDYLHLDQKQDCITCVYSENYKIESLNNDLCFKGQEGCHLMNTDKEAILIMEINNRARHKKKIGKHRKVSNR